MLDRFVKSLIVCGIGLLVVFVILAIIIFVIKLVEYGSKINYSKIGGKIKSAFKKKDKDEKISPELVAVITSAIYAAFYADNDFKANEGDIPAGKVPFKVRSIKRVK